MGTSGGVFGLDRGYCLMIGGDDTAVERLDPFFSALAPGVDAAPRTPGARGRAGDGGRTGYLHCGPAGAGHFVKMVHNGIEYGMMAAYAEGLNILERANVGAEQQEHDAETTPLRDPEAYMYDLPIAEIAEVWRRGSVVASWLLDLTAQALHRTPSSRASRAASRTRARAAGRRWRPSTRACRRRSSRPRSYTRFESRGEGDFGNRALSAMRFGFGGHLEKSGPSARRRGTTRAEAREALDEAVARRSAPA